jgi:hypothetical protein
MAKKYKSNISLVTILDTSPGYWANTNLWNKALGGAKTLVTKEFESFESTAKKAKVSFHSKIIESHSITKTIVSYSKSKKIDLRIIFSKLF